MSISTRQIGDNSYSIDAKQDTSVQIILQEIIRIVSLLNTDDQPLHGWELVSIQYNKRLVRINVDLTFDTIAWFRSTCESGSFKYAAIGVVEPGIITMMAANNFSDDLSSLITLSPHHVTGISNGYISVGITDHTMRIPYEDRYSFFLYINPKWLAFTVLSYSSTTVTNSWTGILNFEAVGLIGIFETYSCVPGIDFALINSIMTLDGNQYTWHHPGYPTVANGIAIRQQGKYEYGASGIKVCNAGELPTANYGLYGGLHYCSSSLGVNDCTMLDLYDTNDEAVYNTMKKVGSLYGLKAIKYSQNLTTMSKAKVQCDDTGRINISQGYRPHWVVLSTLESNAVSANRQSALLIPA